MSSPNNCNTPGSEEAVLKAVRDMLKDQRAAARRRQVLAAVGMATVAVLVVIALHVRGDDAPQLQRDVVSTERPELAEGGFTEGLDASVPGLSVPLPKKPLPNWKKPPCSTKQREINGACWMPLAYPPGDDRCGETYEYEGACWAPVAERGRAPLTIER